MEFRIKASTLRKDYLEFIASGEYNEAVWNIYLCLFMEHKYNPRYPIDDNKNLLNYLPEEYVSRLVRYSNHGVQGYVTHEFGRQMVDAGCEVLAWPSTAVPQDHFDWNRNERAAFRVGLLSYIIQQHGDVELSFNVVDSDD